MTIQVQAAFAVALAGAVAGACATAPGQEYRDEPPGSQTMVEVTNNNWLDVTVYAIWSGTRTRLGTVTSRSTQTFPLPRTMVTNGSVQLLAAPIGSRRAHRTEMIMIVGGDRIVWNVESSLPQSSYMVRPARNR